MLRSLIPTFVKVSGKSMEPTLSDGDFLVVTQLKCEPTKRARTLRPGFLVVAHHERLGRLIKRVLRIDDQGIWLVGDNPASTSSLEMGAFLPSQIKHRVRLVITPSGVHRAR